MRKMGQRQFFDCTQEKIVGYTMATFKVSFKAFICTIAIALASNSSSSANEQDYNFIFESNSDYWPTRGWETSTPEKQGMRSETLAALLETVNSNNEPINSILIIRNGYIIVEANKNRREELHPLWSSTKSVSSALIGLAHTQGIIENTDQPLTDFFANHFTKDNQTRWRTPTLGDLLTMSTGLDWPELETSPNHPENPLYKMHISNNWVDYILSRERIREPGKNFNYNSGGSHLLLAVLAQCGLDVEKYAYENLFQPLGLLVEDYRWSKDPLGIPNGSHGLVMKPRDMAKIGYLYLKGGVWEGKQIISRQWIADSTARHIDINWGGKIAKHYGYQWYIQPYGFHSMGYFGQFIFVLPNHNVVAVFTSEMAKHELEIPIRFVENYLLEAIQSRSELPSNKVGFERLSRQVDIFNK